jgi:hypothetical protein
MANRAFEEGYLCAAMHCPSGRRGLWFRQNPDGTLEICAGREGDDAYARITNPKLAAEVFEVLSYAHHEVQKHAWYGQFGWQCP